MRLLHGIDVSDNNGPVNFARVAAAVDFAYMKATEGATYTDKLFADFWEAARIEAELGPFQIGAYHMLTPTSSARDQAEHFLRTAPAGSIALPPMLDLELGNPSRMGAVALEWLDRVRDARGVTPFVYTFPEYGDELREDELAAWPLWVAHWKRPIKFLGVSPRMPRPWREAGATWSIWQHRRDGRVDGVGGPVDLDCWRAPEDGATVGS